VQRGPSSLSYADDGMEVCYPRAKPHGGIHMYSAHATGLGMTREQIARTLSLCFLASAAGVGFKRSTAKTYTPRITSAFPSLSNVYCELDWIGCKWRGH